ncbi:MAG: N-acetylmuramoyl-L-alanine amidase [Clostridia bacterium]|nr:N-acetylmuramoyl-L-alanine amidase [Clostridia bacterium]
MAIKVYIDQGHNPVNPNAGAEGNGLREQNLVYEIGRELADLLRANGNFEVRLSRPTPQTQLGNSTSSSLRIRVNEANSWGADYFISLHTNASTSPAANGSEALVYSSPSRAASLAEDILEELSEATGLRNRGVKVRSGLYVLRKTQMPAVLVELAFISNPEEAALMRDRPELFARGIYNGIVEYTGV